MIKLHQAFFILFLYFNLSAHASSTTCTKLLSLNYFEPHETRTFNHLNIPITYLGAGGFGAVYRVSPEESEDFVIKRYHKGKSVFAISDIENLERLSAIDASDLSMRTVNIIGTRPERDVFMESIKGRSLLSILRSDFTEVSLEIKKDLLSRYSAFIPRAQKYYEETFNIRADIKPYVYGQSIGINISVLEAIDAGKDIFITIKPDNIIVDAKTLEMIIIDPW